MEHWQDGQTFTETRKELAERYFPLLTSAYERGNMGIISLLSDCQELIARCPFDENTKEHYRQLLNDIKCVLIKDEKRQETDEGFKEMGSPVSNPYTRRNSRGIPIDPKHGLAPMMCSCEICGEDTGAIALLGRHVRKLKDASGKPYEYHGSSAEKIASGFCKRCEDLLKQGNTAFVSPAGATIVARNAVQRMFGVDAAKYEGKVVRLSAEQFQQMFGNIT